MSPLGLSRSIGLATCIALGCEGNVVETAHDDGSPGDSGGVAADAGGSDGDSDAETEECPRAMDEARIHELDGIDDFLSFGRGDRLLFERGEAITIAGWLNPSEIDGYDPVVGRPVPCANAGNFLLDLNGGALRFCYAEPDFATSHCAAVSSEPLPLNEWTHFALVYRFGDGGSLRTYINGELVNTGTWFLGDGNGDPSVRPVDVVHAGHFAGCEAGSNYFYHGQMYELTVFDRALAPEQIVELWCRRTPLYCTDGEHRAEEIQLTLLDEDATGYATFQSHNQKVVVNQYGIFVAYIRARNEEYTAQTWRLMRSTDEGQSFATIFEEVAGTNPPAMETDRHGNLYLMRQSYGSGTGSSWLYMFRPETGFTNPSTYEVPGGDSGKYAMVFDPGRNRLYYFSHYGEIYALGTDGAVLLRQPLITSGPNAGPQYPYLALDETGTLYAAWTSLRHGEYLYWSIHVVRSLDGGQSWQRLDGTPLALPVVCDETGPTQEVTLADEHSVHTWLWNLIARHGKVHMAYLAQATPSRQHYVRYDAALGVEDLRIQPDFGGDELSLRSLDGFAVFDPASPWRLFWVSVAPSPSPRLAVLQSQDRGSSWLDFARSSANVTSFYSVTGYREVSESGHIHGVFTDVSNPDAVRVWYFRVKVRDSDAPVVCL